MTTPVTSSALATVDDAEAAWLAALLAPDAGPLRALLHPQFVAVHGPVGLIQDAEQFLAATAGRGPAQRVEILASTVRYFSDMATVSCLQEMHAAFVPDLPPFVIQAAVTRVWVRDGGPRRRRLHPGHVRRLHRPGHPAGVRPRLRGPRPCLGGVP